VFDTTRKTWVVIGIIVIVLAAIWGVVRVISSAAKEGAFKHWGFVPPAEEQKQGYADFSVDPERHIAAQSEADFIAADIERIIDEYAATDPDLQQWLEQTSMSTTTPIERAIINPIATIIRVIAVVLMLVIWVGIVGPIWLAFLLRTIAAFSIATVAALFTGSTPPSVQRLDAVVELWVSRFRKIVANISPSATTSTQYVPINPAQALVEIVLAIFFYAGISTYFWLFAHLSSLLYMA
jgi:hypothetical protein